MVAVCVVTSLRRKLGVQKGTLGFLAFEAGSAIRTKKQYAKKASRKNKKYPEKTKKVWE
jgi:hypothetical protein